MNVQRLKPGGRFFINILISKCIGDIYRRNDNLMKRPTV